MLLKVSIEMFINPNEYFIFKSQKKTEKSTAPTMKGA